MTALFVDVASFADIKPFCRSSSINHCDRWIARDAAIYDVMYTLPVDPSTVPLILQDDEGMHTKTHSTHAKVHTKIAFFRVLDTVKANIGH